MKNSLWNVKRFLGISRNQSQLKHTSTQVKRNKVQVQNESSQSEVSSRKKVLFTPNLPREKLQILENVTSVAVGLDHVSWAKISVNNLSVLDWNAYSLPSNFLNVTETDILVLASTISRKIPSSELYVMETMPYSWNRFPNYICLRSMLLVHLSSLNNGAKDPNIVFQKPLVLNNLHSLLIGGERTSAKRVLEKKSCLVFSDNSTTKKFSSKEKTDPYSLVDIRNAQVHCFPSYSVTQQESLSIALLLALTFLDVSVFQNAESISKITKRWSHRILMSCNDSDNFAEL